MRLCTFTRIYAAQRAHFSNINAFYAKVMQRLLQSHGRQMEPVFFFSFGFLLSTPSQAGCQVSELPFPAPTAKNKTRLPPEQQQKTRTRPNSKKKTRPHQHPSAQTAKNKRAPAQTAKIHTCTRPSSKKNTHIPNPPPGPKMRGACVFCCLSAGVFCFMLFGPLGGGHVKAQTAKQKIRNTPKKKKQTTKNRSYRRQIISLHNHFVRETTMRNHCVEIWRGTLRSASFCTAHKHKLHKAQVHAAVMRRLCAYARSPTFMQPKQRTFA